VAVDEVPERDRSFADTADWIRRMRSSDTFLTALTDAEVGAVVSALRARPREADRFELSLVTFQPAGRQRPVEPSINSRRMSA
jgi:hypothetical protein